jgi:hypothetical protein
VTFSASSSDSSDDEDKRKRTRTNFSNAQIDELEKAFQDSHYPDVYTREALSIKLDLLESRIQVWFQNRRAKVSRAEREKRPVAFVVSSGESWKTRAKVLADLRRMLIDTRVRANRSPPTNWPNDVLGPKRKNRERRVRVIRVHLFLPPCHIRSNEFFLNHRRRKPKFDHHDGSPSQMDECLEANRSSFLFTE